MTVCIVCNASFCEGGNRFVSEVHEVWNKDEGKI